MRDILRAYALETLADRDAAPVIDETGFLKQGHATCGVARQYTGSAGEITSCEIGAVVAHVSYPGYAFIDRALYLPKVWADDVEWGRKAHGPREVGSVIKSAIACTMIARAVAADVPFSWLAAGSVHGVGDIGMALRRAGKGYGPGVIAKHWVQRLGQALCRCRNSEGYRRGLAPECLARPFGWHGDKGECLHDWACVELADPETADSRCLARGLARGLLIRRNIPMALWPFPPPGSSARYLHGNTGAGRRPPMGDPGRGRDRE